MGLKRSFIEEMDNMTKHLIHDVQRLKERIEQLFNIGQNLAKRINELEIVAHPKREFVKCKECEERITESNKLMQSIGEDI